jgi:hypothetical protein
LSEYQYYEFQALDRPLTEQEQAYIHTLSSRVELTPVQAVFVYHYGDFRADPLDVLETCFDALLYVANWGAKRLAFRFPKDIVDHGALTRYCMPEELTLTTTEQHVLLDINLYEEEGGDWIEAEGLLSALAPLRNDLLRGDLRALYLAWLKVAPHMELWEDDPDIADGLSDGEAEAAESPLEPPVPPGLGQLSAPLHAFVEFFEIDQDLIAAAAEASPPLDMADEPVEQWVAMLPEAERTAFLVRVARGEPHVGMQLMRRLRELGRGAGQGGIMAAPPRRTFAALLAKAEERERRRKAEEQRKAERARLQRIEALAQREPAAWSQVTALIEQKRARPYDEAVALLKELRALANHRGQQAQFAARIDEIRSSYANRPAFLDRLQRAGLIKDAR